MKVVVKIARFNPEKPESGGVETFSLDASPTDRVLDLLLKLKDTQDRGLAFRKSCAHGVCGSDAMLINGKERLACKTLVQDLTDGKDVITIEPLKNFPVQRDLMVKPDLFFEKYRQVSPFLIEKIPPPAKGEYHQSVKERAMFDGPTKCILCSACYSACPVLEKGINFIGPAASVQAARFLKDSRDKGLPPRMAVLGTPNGVSACENHFECTRVCPRGILITKIITETKSLVNKYRAEKGETNENT